MKTALMTIDNSRQVKRLQFRIKDSYNNIEHLNIHTTNGIWLCSPSGTPFRLSNIVKDKSISLEDELLLLIQDNKYNEVLDFLIENTYGTIIDIRVFYI